MSGIEVQGGFPIPLWSNSDFKARSYAEFFFNAQGWFYGIDYARGCGTISSCH